MDGESETWRERVRERDRWMEVWVHPSAETLWGFGSGSIRSCMLGGWGPTRVGLVPARPTDTGSDCDLGNLEARSSPSALCHVPQVVPEPGGNISLQQDDQLSVV